ncbi:IS3 family transposase [Oscillibacter sp. MSJ-2]|uniref:IS3 family transposase n=1 Tax=Dysosmobacter acutus TaxID=2841504 RepID=A0ABS6FBM7_9FIRM|nr:IS3 family transposase [Dysosmobacter acutus]MBU5627675.1 IS3 family transposase [Dysosmobacter acutus]
MKERLTPEEKQRLVVRYQSGEPVKALCAEVGASKSSFYEWIGQYRETKTLSGQVMTPREFEFLRRRAQKLEEMLTVLKTAGCTVSAPLQEKLKELEKLYGQFSVHVLCEAMEVSRGTFYNFMFRSKRGNSAAAMRREELRVQIRDVYEENRQLFGAGKIRAILVERGQRVSQKLVAELMREMGLSSIRVTAKRDYERLQSYEKKANILKQQFQTQEPNQVWVSDVTCFRLKDRWFYICVMIDLFSRKVVTCGISQKNSTRLITTTFKQAFAERKPKKGLIFHSDQGAQYTAYAFRKLLKTVGVTQSFSKPGTPHDNAVAEAFFASFKKEELYRTNYHSEAEFRRRVLDYMDFYNNGRPHRTLHYKTPNRVEQDFQLHDLESSRS